MSSTDSKSRRSSALAAHGDDLSADETAIISSFTSAAIGGGWGLSAAYLPSAMDTALVLHAAEALAISPSISAEIDSALQFLMDAEIGANAGWQGAVVTGNPAGDAVVTALVLRALMETSGSLVGLEALQDSAAIFLLTRVSAASPLLHQALASLALLRWSAPATASAGSLLASLEAQQIPDGSIGGDIYATALALHAFSVELGTDASLLQETISIADLGLRKAINASLGKNGLDAITRGEILSLTDLDASGSRIENLAGLEEAQNLVSVNLLGNPVPDLSPLDAIAGLVTIVVAGRCDPNLDGIFDAGDAMLALRLHRDGVSLGIDLFRSLDVAPQSARDGEFTIGDVLVVLRAARGVSMPGCSG